ncbi:MAG: TetR/AcrR family transcriptional regulator [Clostridia bacterium]|nr:TetR/AcrR family transcriptional regulator [Clostridia bacterium]
MGNTDIRKPIQKRSIETKEKILKAGFELICEKGYYNTNTAEIAKAANVSTGIVYQYFKDKHDILVESLQNYGSSVFYPMIKVSEKDFAKNDLDTILRNMINKFIKNHKMSHSAHKEIMAMVHSDDAVAEIYHNSEIEMTDNLIKIFADNGITTDHLKEKVHVAVNLIDDLCHEVVYHKHDSMDYNVMIDVVVKCIKDLLK